MIEKENVKQKIPLDWFLEVTGVQVKGMVERISSLGEDAKSDTILELKNGCIDLHESIQSQIAEVQDKKELNCFLQILLHFDLHLKNSYKKLVFTFPQ